MKPASVTVIEVELRDWKQDPCKGQIRAEPAEERLDTGEGPVDQRGVLDAHAVQYAHGLHQALKEGTTQAMRVL